MAVTATSTAKTATRFSLVALAFLLVALLTAFALVTGCSNGESTSAAPEAEPDTPLAASAYMEEAAEQVAGLTLEEKVAQLFIIRPEDIAVEEHMTTPSSATLRGLTLRAPGGICYFAENFQSPDQARKLLNYLQQAASSSTGLPLLQCVDEEGGEVSRIANNPNMNVQNVGTAESIGEAGSTQAAADAASTMCVYLHDLGFNLDFAPVADIADGEDNTIGPRAFGTDAQSVSPLVAAQVQAFDAAGILCSAKHFPGVGGVSGDSHEGLITTKATLADMQSSEFLPFRAAIEAGVPMVMVGHIACPNVTGDKLPASLSPEMIRLLREELAFEGVIITDSLEMDAIAESYTDAEAAIRALLAGADLLLLPSDYEAAYQGVLDAVKDGTLDEADIDAHVQRVIAMKLAQAARS